MHVRAVRLNSRAKVVGVLCGSLFDPRAGAVLTNLLIEIRDGVVRNVTTFQPNHPTYDFDWFVNLTDKFVLPGLIDAHTHLFLRPYNVVAWEDQARSSPTFARQTTLMA